MKETKLQIVFFFLFCLGVCVCGGGGDGRVTNTYHKFQKCRKHLGYLFVVNISFFIIYNNNYTNMAKLKNSLFPAAANFFFFTMPIC